MIEKLENNLIERKEKNILSGYKELLNDLKKKVQTSRLKAAVRVNQELINLYWDIGNKIFEKQEKQEWEAKVIEKLAKDLKNYFVNMKGFSLTNLKYMVQFAKTYPDIAISQQAVGQIPWGHNIIIMQKIENEKERIWYAQETINHGWSRSMLETWIDSKLLI